MSIKKNVLLNLFFTFLILPSEKRTKNRAPCTFGVGAEKKNTHTHSLLLLTHIETIRSAAEELVRSQFGAFKSLPSEQADTKNQAHQQQQNHRRQALGGSAMSLNKLADSVPLSSRNASSIPDLTNPPTTCPTNANGGGNKPPLPGDFAAAGSGGGQSKQLSDDLKTINSNTEPATIRSKFTPGNIFKNFFK